MKNLFKKYISEGKVAEALLVGQNILNKDINDYECFDIYFNLLISIITDDSDNNKERFIQQATAVLSFFGENVELNDDIVNYIKEKEKQLDDSRKKVLKLKIAENDCVIELLGKLMKKLEGTTAEIGFKETLEQIEKVDSVINNDFLTEQQQVQYNIITKQCTEIVNKKLQSFNDKESIDYNLKAISAYEKVFNYFKNKDVVENHKDIIRLLFDFDSSKLFNETLIYYNHVYNYILSKLNDDEKFLITKYAIMSEKKE